MNMSAVTIDLPASLRERLEDIAKEEGISLNDLIVQMAGKISSNAVLENIKRNAAKRDTRAAFKKLLSAVPDVPPSRSDDVIE